MGKTIGAAAAAVASNVNNSSNVNISISNITGENENYYYLQHVYIVAVATKTNYNNNLCDNKCGQCSFEHVLTSKKQKAGGHTSGACRKRATCGAYNLYIC